MSPCRVMALGAGCFLAYLGAAAAAKPSFEIGGRVSPQVGVTTYPDDSVFQDVFGSSSVDSALDARFVLDIRQGRWNFDIDYQLIGVYSDRLEFTRELPPELRILFPHLPNDRTRLFDLTHVFTDSGKSAALQRLDRLAADFSTEHVVMRFGRQAITWGNGLVYNVMDIFNPFDPAAVDKEFKTGDDMIYGQFLQTNGNDLQAVMVLRRDPITEDVEADQGSLAFKYHHMGNANEFDGLLAQHYGDTLAGGGVNQSIGGAVWRGDITVTFAEEETVASAVTSISQSWIWAGKNVSGLAEYFYNGFGQSDGCYSPDCLAENPELLARIARGELFNLGQHYLALSTMIELNPLFLLTPNVFMNVGDPGALLQLFFQNDLRQNLQLWSALNIPLGADGTEYGGAATEIPGLFLSAGPSVSMQLVWYW